MTNHTVFPASQAGHLDNRLRKLLFNPEGIAKRFVDPGDNVLDIGCGTGFLSRSLARRVGETGMVTAVDIQQEMLDLLKKSADEEGVLARIRTHLAEPYTLGLSGSETFNLAVAWYVVHETLDPARLFREVMTLLVPGGRFLMVEPMFVIQRATFEKECNMAEGAGFSIESKPFFVMSRSVLFTRGK